MGTLYDIVEEGGWEAGNGQEMRLGWESAQPQPTIYSIQPITDQVEVPTFPDAARLTITGRSGQVNSRERQWVQGWSGNR